jgi:hypothetical protein
MFKQNPSFLIFRTKFLSNFFFWFWFSPCYLDYFPLLSMVLPGSELPYNSSNRVEFPTIHHRPLQKKLIEHFTSFPLSHLPSKPFWLITFLHLCPFVPSSIARRCAPLRGFESRVVSLIEVVGLEGMRRSNRSRR